MGKLVSCMLDGAPVDIEAALRLRVDSPGKKYDFRCPCCGEKVRAHKAGTTGQSAHFEHLVRNLQCLAGAMVNSGRIIQSHPRVTSQMREPRPRVDMPEGASKIGDRPDYSDIEVLLPPTCGYPELKPTLCIGLDIAWFGGSKSNPDSQFDCVVAAVVGPDQDSTVVDIQRVQLVGRDPDASLTADTIESILDRYSDRVEKIVLGIDAPLLSTQEIPPGKERAWRAADRTLNDARKAIDQFCGGSNGWHPILQPGAPLAPRVVKLIEQLSDRCGISVWQADRQLDDRLAIEVFPSEAIWVMKRLGGYDNHSTGEGIRAYKKLRGTQLSEVDVRNIVSAVLSPVGSIISYARGWDIIQESALNWMLSDVMMGQGGVYKGGKLLDDVIDSLLCLAAAVAYAKGESHVYVSGLNPDDGHIIGPGVFALPQSV